MDDGAPGFKLAVEDGGDIKVTGICIIATGETFGIICQFPEVKVVMNIDAK